MPNLDEHCARWTNWNQLEASLKRSKESTLGTTVLDYTGLSSAIKQQQREQISQEASNLLKLIYDDVNKLATNESSEQIHPNIQDAKTIIQTYYLLNDIILGLKLGVREEKEINALTAMLENLSKKPGLTINIEALKDTIKK